MSYRIVDDCGPDDGETVSINQQRAVKFQALLAYAADRDWHGVRDVAVELEILDAVQHEHEGNDD